MARPVRGSPLVRRGPVRSNLRTRCRASWR